MSQSTSSSSNRPSALLILFLIIGVAGLVLVILAVAGAASTGIVGIILLLVGIVGAGLLSVMSRSAITPSNGKATASLATDTSAPPVAAVAPVPPVAAVDPVPPVAAVDPVPPVAAVDPTPPVAAVDPVPPVAAVDPTPPVAAVAPTPPGDPAAGLPASSRQAGFSSIQRTKSFFSPGLDTPGTEEWVFALDTSPDIQHTYRATARQSAGGVIWFQGGGIVDITIDGVPTGQLMVIANEKKVKEDIANGSTYRIEMEITSDGLAPATLETLITVDGATLVSNP